jgi:TetR/AcrR family transcriptional regulator
MSKKKERKGPVRGPGRPKAEETDPGRRQALLKRAEQMFAERGYDGVSLRDLADAAGVTPAMIHYYFKNKDGLYAAMLDDVTGRLLEQIEAANAEGVSQDPFRSLMDIASRTVLAEPWAVSLIMRDVLLRPGPLRDRFIENYATRVMELLTMVIIEGKKTGEIRADLDEGFTAISLLGLTAFPFIARGVAESVLGLDYKEQMRKEYVDHAYKLFRKGIDNPGAGGAK